MTNQKTENMSKAEMMEFARRLLEAWGFKSSEYSMGFKGPIIMLSKSGEEKLNTCRRQELEQIGLIILS
jgi:hypothetical protein